jgi:hypothetical protein
MGLVSVFLTKVRHCPTQVAPGLLRQFRSAVSCIAVLIGGMAKQRGGGVAKHHDRRNDTVNDE